MGKLAKEIKRYRLVSNHEGLVDKLKKLGFSEGTFLSRYQEKKVMSKNFFFPNDMSLHIVINVETFEYDDFEDNLVIDEDFGQPYGPFYDVDNVTEQHVGLKKVIKAYNRAMDTLVDAGIMELVPTTITFNKLVRDNIVSIIESDGFSCKKDFLKDKDLRNALLNKLQEEVNEFIVTPNAEELADILEVIDYLKTYFKISEQDINRIKENKHKKKGGYETGTYLYEATIGYDN